MRYQRGQITILMAFLLMFLVGMAGLAMDGGRAYLQHRDLQNTVDAAAMASGHASCTGRDPITAAFDIVERNAWYLRESDPWVWVFNPPISGPGIGDLEYTEVIISGELAPYFIQTVMGGDYTISLSARAVVHCIPADDSGEYPIPPELRIVE